MPKGVHDWNLAYTDSSLVDGRLCGEAARTFNSWAG